MLDCGANQVTSLACSRVVKAPWPVRLGLAQTLKKCSCCKYHLSVMADVKVFGQLLGLLGPNFLGNEISHIDGHACCALL